MSVHTCKLQPATCTLQQLNPALQIVPRIGRQANKPINNRINLKLLPHKLLNNSLIINCQLK